MHITVPLEPTSSRGQQRTLRQQLLKPGATLVGVVHREDGRLALQLGRLRLPIIAQLPLHDGDRLQLRVTVVKGEIRLKLLDRQPMPPTADIKLARQLLPKQGDLAEPFRMALRGATPSCSETLPPGQHKLLAALLERLSEPHRLAHPQGLRRALRDSGVLYEWLLALAPQSAGSISATDIKAALLRLAARSDDTASDDTTGAEDTPRSQHNASRLHEAVEGALSRIRLLQLYNARSDGLDLAFDIPVRDDHNMDRIELRIRKDGSGRRRRESSAQGPLEVTARFHFGSKDTLVARVVLTAETTHITWWATEESLRQQIRAALPVLSERLKAAGLEVGSLACRSDGPPQPRPWPEQTDGGLVDDSA